MTRAQVAQMRARRRAQLGMEPNATAWSSPEVSSPAPTGHTAYHHLGHTAYHHIGDASSPDVWSVLAPAAVGFAAYHGYKRNGSIAWAIGWAIAAVFAPVITTAIALAQGNKRK